MRGDPPVLRSPSTGSFGSTPHARGSTYWMGLSGPRDRVYPACAGIHLFKKGLTVPRYRLPRMRGDPPIQQMGEEDSFRSTPHARGSTCGRGGSWRFVSVYPACAGIHPSTSRVWFLTLRLPRMRGDPPQRCPMFPGLVASTPHARGSTASRSERGLYREVYPACAGIHRRSFCVGSRAQCLPRMRGDPP